MRRLVLVHAAANVALLWLGYYWLGVGESNAARLMWSALVALVLLAGVCWQYGAVLAWFRTGGAGGTGAWRTALRNLAPLALFLIATAAVYMGLTWWRGYSARPALAVASFLTLKLRVPVKPAAVQQVCNVLLWLAWWVVVPVLLLPAASAVAGRGWRGYRAVGALVKRPLYWLLAPVCMLAMCWAPLKLLGWVPLKGGFGLESASFAVRAALAYALFVAGWIVAARVSAGCDLPRRHGDGTE